jgi:hypothetical protein
MPGSGDAREDLALRVAEEIAMTYEEAELAIKEYIARMLARDIEAPDWALIKEAQLGQLRRKAQLEVKKLDRGLTSIDGQIQDAYKAGTTGAEVTIDSAFFHVNTAAMKALAAEKAKAIGSTHFQILRRTVDAYRDAVSEGVSLSASGVLTRRQGAMKALDQLTERGFGHFVDKRGRAWSLRSYVEMSMRTGVSNAMLEGRLTAYQAAGHDLVIISDAPEECSICRPWEGRILSISGSDDKSHASLTAAKAAGLFHPNCRHSAHRWIKGLTKPLYNTKTADPEGDNLRQKQRYLERQVRAKKERVAVNKAWLEQDKHFDARKALVKSQDQLDVANAKLVTFIKNNDRKRLRYREQIKSAI